MILYELLAYLLVAALIGGALLFVLAPIVGWIMLGDRQRWRELKHQRRHINRPD